MGSSHGSCRLWRLKCGAPRRLAPVFYTALFVALDACPYFWHWFSSYPVNKSRSNFIVIPGEISCFSLGICYVPFSFIGLFNEWRVDKFALGHLIKSNVTFIEEWWRAECHLLEKRLQYKHWFNISKYNCYINAKKKNVLIFSMYLYPKIQQKQLPMDTSQ